MVHHDFMACVTGSMLFDVRSGANRIISKRGGITSLKSSPRIVEARTQVVKNFLTNEAFKEAEWLVTLDTDMTWDDGAIHRMIDKAEKHDRPIVGGLCIAGGHSGDQYVTAYVNKGSGENTLPVIDRVDLSTPDFQRAILEDGASMQVDATGAAFMILRRDLLIAMYAAYSHEGKNPHPWYGELHGPNGEQYGEDITLCLRARELGAQVWLDMSCRIGHIKENPLTYETYLDTKKNS